MNKKIKVLFLILTIIVVLVLINKIIKTYALFYSEAEANVIEKIGNWTIKVNNKDISNGIVEKFNIEQLQLDVNENVKEGKIAPGLKGKFLIIIDPTDTDVSIRYDVSFDTSLLKTENIKLDKIEKIDSEDVLTKIEDNTYSGIISLSDINNGKKDKIEVTFSWEDIELYNDSDTELGKIKDNQISIPITVTITQYLGENILPI